MNTFKRFVSFIIMVCAFIGFSAKAKENIDKNEKQLREKIHDEIIFRKMKESGRVKTVKADSGTVCDGNGVDGH